MVRPPVVPLLARLGTMSYPKPHREDEWQEGGCPAYLGWCRRVLSRQFIEQRGVLWLPRYPANSSSNAFASWRSAVSNPSVNQP
jgi:hypothetical protein